MKLKYLYLTYSLVLIGALFFFAFNSVEGAEDPKPNKEIIKFSHKLHADLAECSACHMQVSTSTSLKDRLMPNHESCGSCHEEVESDCEKCHYEEQLPLNQNTGNLMFNHKFHIEQEKMECTACHKGIAEVDYAEDAIRKDPDMEDCSTTCHTSNSKATAMCEGCHIETANLVPQNHKTVNFERSHKFLADESNANCQMCHFNGQNSCEDCHAATEYITEQGTSKDFVKNYAPNNFVNGPRYQKLNRVHDLNYRFTHGVEAVNKRLDCQSCHQTETFCTNCHQVEQNGNLSGGVVPASHLKQGFFTYAVGSGGGIHADLARRDIETCVACHDVQGADPTCVRCHHDFDGIKGNNPKTHETGFMRGEAGDWHHDQASVCYNCHSGSPSTPVGTGFCNYCHGVK